ncbi:hypothetical protein B296_00003116 [Ensete ventricosum]|uniref:Plant bHLH transcription factor ACT-like domain-containing protein n=1 Tax=Ensete ventricosum TaxID=4639 RepID=A0A427AWZ8_ENSVE|nr:hypothetical protein B296_00003116 [Ensete ventricosum]
MTCCSCWFVVFTLKTLMAVGKNSDSFVSNIVKILVVMHQLSAYWITTCSLKSFQFTLSGQGDQASIVGGAINFVKELEHLVQSLEARKRIRGRSQAAPFADFFTFPQYSSSPSSTASDGSTGDAVADIEVTIFESHANIKIFSRWRPRQLLELVLGLQGLRLTTLHLNVTTVDEMVLYCFSLKVEDDCQCTSVDVIATAVHQIIVRVEEEATQN